MVRRTPHVPFCHSPAACLAMEVCGEGKASGEKGGGPPRAREVSEPGTLDIMKVRFVSAMEVEGGDE